MLAKKQLRKRLRWSSMVLKMLKFITNSLLRSYMMITIEKGQGVEASSGALAVNTGEFTGRSPKDRFIVKDSITKDKVWWGDINIPFDPEKFDALYDKGDRLPFRKRSICHGFLCVFR